MQAELQTALFNAFDTLNLQQMKSFNVPPVTLHGVGALAACGPQAQSRALGICLSWLTVFSIRRE
ncbi:ethanolamine utilization protein EutG [Klebsiella pneumoniae]|nr:ethanolamine utilization protein EutG [Klebsiella pneumoniae]